MDDFDKDFASITKKPLRISSGKDKKSKVTLDITKNDLNSDVSNDIKIIKTTATKAEQAFKSKQEKVSEGRIMKKASKTHKQRVEEFNKHLDSLSEHYDIPKVSWTK